MTHTGKRWPVRKWPCKVTARTTGKTQAHEVMTDTPETRAQNVMTASKHRPMKRWSDELSPGRPGGRFRKAVLGGWAESSAGSRPTKWWRTQGDRPTKRQATQASDMMTKRHICKTKTTQTYPTTTLSSITMGHMLQWHPSKKTKKNPSFICKVMYQLNITKLLYSIAAAHATAQPFV